MIPRIVLLRYVDYIWIPVGRLDNLNKFENVVTHRQSSGSFLRKESPFLGIASNGSVEREIPRIHVNSVGLAAVIIVKIMSL